jgi:hypothetical protein
MPLDLMERIMKMGSNVGDLILDPFCGTSSTIIAAHQSGRRWLGCDCSPEAYTHSLRRLEQTCGLRPEVDFHVGDQHVLETTFPIIQTMNKSVLDRFVFGEVVDDEETLHCEFKEIKGLRAVESIKNIADEYVVAFLNRDGGKIYWGIRNSDRMVVGVRLTAEERDEVRRVVTEKLTQIQPPITPSTWKVELHCVYQHNRPVSDLYIVEIAVPRVSKQHLYYTGSEKAFIKTDGGRKELKGPRLEAEILKRHGL